MIFKKIIVTFLVLCAVTAFAQENLIVNTQNRKQVSLNGTWHYIIDPYETGFYDYRYKEKGEKDAEAYWNNPEPNGKTDRKEHGYNNDYSIQVPGDWNSQDDVFKYYEGTVWYQREFDKPKLDENERIFLYFGAVNYEAHVYLNGKKLGMHKGGFTPFNFEISPGMLKDKSNFLVVKVDNKRYADEVPTLNTDWWNYGGITRDVKLIITPQNFIQQYAIHLKQSQDIEKSLKRKRFNISGYFKLNTTAAEEKITIEIPEIGFSSK